MSSEVSREKPTDYAEMARILVDERARGGYVVWVVGPAVLHARGRDTVSWFIENGFVQAFLGGNAVAVHDIESAVMGTTLGMDDRGAPVQRRARLPHARHQPRPCRGVHRRGGGTGGGPHGHHEVAGPDRACPSCSPGPSATTGRSPRPSPTCRRRRRRCAPTPARHGGAHDRHGAALHRHRQHAPRLRPRRGERRGSPAGHHLRGLVGVRGGEAEGPRDAPGVRGDHQRAGLPARAPLLRGARGWPPRAARG